MWFSSGQLSYLVMSDSLRPHGLQHAWLPFLHQLPEIAQTHIQSSRWCHPTISPSVVPFSSCLQSFPTSGSFPMSQFFTSGGQSIWVSASASVLPMNIQNWVPLGLTGLIFFQFKGLSRVFSSTIVEEPEKQRNQKSNCQYLLDHRQCKRITENH